MPLRLSILLAALWWGAISSLSFLVVPTLFVKLGATVAGPVAAQMFTLQCWIGIVLGLALLLLLRRARAVAQLPLGGQSSGAEPFAATQRGLITMGFVLAAMLLALLQEFGVAQKIVTARATGGDLGLWHTLGSVMVLGQWLCAGSVLWSLSNDAKP